MPELPEVETVKNVLKKILINRKIIGIDVLRMSIIHSDIPTFKESLIGETFLDITRIGKFLIFHMSHDLVIISHLRMEGKYLEVNENDANTKYARVIFHLDNGHKICYDDSRTFGMMKLSNEKDYLKEKDIAQLGPEPFDVDINYLINRTKKIRNPIKSTLLDQTLMTGLGNIYADEVLFASKIHPLTEANKISKKEWETIVNNSKRILKAAIEAGGSTIRSYHPGKDIDGNFQSALLAYGNKDKPCPNCSTLMRFMKVNGRGTTFCPNCQRRKTDQLKIAIYGKVSSGKSTILSAFKEKGAFVVSSDDIVKELYQEEKVAKLFNKEFGLNFTTFVDKDVLRNHLLDNPKDKKKVEKLVHPLVKERVKELFIKQKESLIVVEVPLLYESKMENMFDVVIAVEVPLDKQVELINKRNATTADALMEINKTHQFEKNKRKADYLLVNDASLSKFNKKINDLINKLQGRLG
ncbi:MAG: DNA-formamidopyrimidine glycosylase [Bacilli bacterium]|nr:DNA-formamidopyrimidine glycosylase [Bacilli bacterium]